MIIRYNCGCYSSLETEKLCNARHVNYPCFKHKRGTDVGTTQVFVKVIRRIVNYKLKTVPLVER